MIWVPCGIGDTLKRTFLFPCLYDYKQKNIVPGSGIRYVCGESLNHRGEMGVENSTDKKEQQSIETQKTAKKRENVIVALFKILLQVNFLRMGTKKSF